MYCKNCKKRITRDAKFCPKCGYEFIDNEIVESSYSINRKSKSKLIICTIGSLLSVIIAIVGYLGFNNSTNKLYPVYSNEKWGLMNKDGKIIIEPQFDYIENYESGIFIVEKNRKKHLLDKKGKYLIDSAFDDIYYCEDREGIYVIVKDDKEGLINSKGDILIEPQFDNIFRNLEDKEVVRVENNYNYGLMNIQGEIVVEPQYDMMGSISEGLATIRVNEKWGYINTQGDIVIDPKFDSADKFSEDLAAIEVDGYHGYIDKEGNIIIEPQFNNACEFSEGLAAIEVNGKWGYINKKGDIVIEPQFNEADKFSQDLAAIELNGKWGYINTHGNIILDTQLDYINTRIGWMDKDPLLYIGGQNEKSIVIDKKGEIVAQVDGFKYDNEYGLIGVCIDGRLGYINDNGEIVIEPEFDWNIWEDDQNLFNYTAEYEFINEIIKVSKNNKIGYINSKGETIIELQYDSAKVFSDYLVIGVNGDIIDYIDLKDNKKIVPQLDDNTDIIPEFY